MKLKGSLQFSKRELSYIRSLVQVVSDKLIEVETSKLVLTEKEISVRGKPEGVTQEKYDLDVMQEYERSRNSLLRYTEKTTAQCAAVKHAIDNFSDMSFTSKSFTAHLTANVDDFGNKGWEYDIDMSSDVICLMSLLYELYFEMFSKAMTFLTLNFPMDKLKLIMSMSQGISFNAINPDESPVTGE